MDTHFEVTAVGPIPQNHGYQLLASLAAVFPFLHGRPDLQISPLNGKRMRDNRLALDSKSRLTIRGLSHDERVLMTGKVIDLAGTPLFISRSQYVPFRPAPTLSSRLVVFKDMTMHEGQIDREAFLLRLLGVIAAKTGQTDVKATLFRQRSLAVKGMHLLGHSVTLTNLTPESSLTLQAQGIGHGTSMGCGMFRPALETPA